MRRSSALLLVYLVIGQSVLGLLDTTGFVAWRNAPRNALRAKEEFEIKFMFDNPCKALKTGFPSAFDKDKELSFGDHLKCDKYYYDKIMVEMGWLQERYSAAHKRTKRAIPLLGLMGGIWMSNIIDSVFHTNEEVARHEHGQNDLLLSLNKRLDFSTKAIAELAMSHKISMQALNDILAQSNEEQRTYHRLQAATGYIMRRIEDKFAAIQALRFGLVNKHELDLQALNRLFDTTYFENIDSGTIEFNSMGWKDNTLTLLFWGHRINRDYRVYSVKALSHWVNVTQGLASFVEYDGPKYVVVNADKNCIYGINQLHEDDLATECEVINGRFGDLDKWLVLKRGDPFIDIMPTSYIQNLPDNWIYCLGRQLRTKSGPWQDCPARSFKLKASIGWQTDDKVFVGMTTTRLNFNMTTTIPDGIIPDDVQEPFGSKFSETDALRKVFNLTRALEIENAKTFLLTTPIGGVSHTMMNKILILSVVCVLIIFVWYVRHQHKHLIRRHGKTIQQVKLHIDKLTRGETYPALPEETIDEEVIKQRAISKVLNACFPKKATDTNAIPETVPAIA